jgi:hypothetical protein
MCKVGVHERADALQMMCTKPGMMCIGVHGRQNDVHWCARKPSTPIACTTPNSESAFARHITVVFRGQKGNRHWDRHVYYMRFSCAVMQ